METVNDAPRLLRLIFGEAACMALRGASPRLLLWSQIFDDWLAEREHTHSKAYCKHLLRAWSRLYTHCDRMPWELRQADIANHVERLIEEGYKPKTISSDLSMLSNFFRWCNQKDFDPECEPSFNPCAGVPHPRVESFKVSSAVLSKVEIDVLLRILRADRSPIGLRDYALILARLNLGIPFRELQRLQWGQISADSSSIWVRWRPGSEPARLPEKVWEAIKIFLEETGRLPVMSDRSFIFAGISNWPKVVLEGIQPEWSEKHLSNDQILDNLKLYGRKAGIPDEKLNMQALRRTAIQLHLKTEESLEQTQRFIGWRGPLRDTRFRLQALDRVPQDNCEVSQETGKEIEIPNRKPQLYQPGDGYIHGFFARSQPMEEIRSVLAEDIQGLEEQIVTLRVLGRRLFERQVEGRVGADSARIVELYIKVSGWLSEMIRTEGLLKKRGKEETWADEFLAGIDKLCQDEGETLDRESLMMEAMEINPDLDLAARHLREEIATCRFLLRNTLNAAAEAQDDKTYLRMVDLYGEGSARLARLLRRQKDNQGNLGVYIRKLVDQAVEEVLAGWVT